MALIGPRCSGKTSVGRELARLLAWPFVDLDDEIAAARAAPGAGEVLAEVGEPAFRALEERLLRERIAQGGPVVIACGGGVVENENSRQVLARRATCVWLRVSATELARRMRADPTIRPSLTGGDPVEEIETVMARREPLYAEVAAITIDGRGLGIDEIAARVRSDLGRGGLPGCRG
ncbi:MAG: shikimate kinase [Planctomycetota bacterium]